MTARHLGIFDRLELVHVELVKGAQRSPEHLGRNPNGRVPVLEDGALVLWESHAIMQYLADSVPGQTLYPEERAARADVNRWLFWNASHFGPAVAILNRERLVKRFIDAGDADPSEIARGEGLFREFARVLDGHLRGKQWIAQGTVTLGDLAIASELATTEAASLPIAEFSELTAWFQRVRQLDAWGE